MSTTSNLGLFKHDNPSTNTDQFNVGKALNENWDKLDAEAGDTKENLEKLKAENALLKQDMQASQITETTESESLILEDCASARLIDFEIKGNSKQEDEPSPENPSEIKSVGDNGNIKIKETTKNLLNPQKVVEDSNNNYVYIENEYIKYATDSSRILLRPLLIKENTSYTYRLICKSGVDTTNSIKFTAVYQDGSTENLVDKVQINQNEFMLIFKTNNLKTLDCVRSAYTDGKLAYVKINGSMILEGDRTSDIGNIEYIPNEEKTYLISINEPLRSLPNGICDILKMNSGVRKIGKIILDGNFNIITSGTNTLGYTWVVLPNDLAPLAKKGEKRKPFCNIAIGSTETGYQNFNSSKIIQWHNTTASFVMTLPTEIVGSTISQVKTYFQEQYNNGNPVIVYYELAEEIIEPYTKQQQLVIDEIINNPMYKEITHIFSDDEVSPNLKATYAKDLNSVITKINDAIIAEGSI